MQPEKAPSPMLVTLLPMVTEVKEVQFANLLGPMDFTAFPITYSFTWSPKISFIEIDLLAISLLSKVTEVRLEQSQYLQLVVCQSILSKTVEK